MFKKLSFVLCCIILLASCNVQRRMRHDIDFSATRVTSDVNINYVSRTELRNYAHQIIAANGLKRYYIDRQWKIPNLNKLSPQQKIVAYILLELRLATIDDTYYNLVPEVSFLRRSDGIDNGFEKVALDWACLATFRSICPIDKSVIAHVCVEKCADGGIYSLDMTSSLNAQQVPSQRNTVVEAIGYAMKNLFEKLSVNANSSMPHLQSNQK